ncbi:MAG: hypothetical protein AB8E15_04880 [Bdellovibrionales bacterium]
MKNLLILAFMLFANTAFAANYLWTDDYIIEMNVQVRGDLDLEKGYTIAAVYDRSPMKDKSIGETSSESLPIGYYLVKYSPQKSRLKPVKSYNKRTRLIIYSFDLFATFQPESMEGTSQYPSKFWIHSNSPVNSKGPKTEYETVGLTAVNSYPKSGFNKDFFAKDSLFVANKMKLSFYQGKFALMAKPKITGYSMNF